MTRILRLPDVIKLSGLSRSTIYSYIKKGLWPKQVPLGDRVVGWPLEEVELILRARIAKYTNEDIKVLIDTLMEKRSQKNREIEYDTGKS
jgi:prophage regulatory protein